MSKHQEKFEEYFKEANELTLKTIGRGLTSLEKTHMNNAFLNGYFVGSKPIIQATKK